MKTRRELISLLGGAVAWPLAARAQQPSRMRRIGLLVGNAEDHEAQSTIPVVFVLVADPVGSGYVASLPRPGGNATGFTPIVGSLGGKWVELLKEMAPQLG